MTDTVVFSTAVFSTPTRSASLALGWRQHMRACMCSCIKQLRPNHAPVISCPVYRYISHCRPTLLSAATPYRSSWPCLTVSSQQYLQRCLPLNVSASGSCLPGYARCQTSCQRCAWQLAQSGLPGACCGNNTAGDTDVATGKAAKCCTKSCLPCSRCHLSPPQACPPTTTRSSAPMSSTAATTSSRQQRATPPSAASARHWAASRCNGACQHVPPCCQQLQSC